MGKNIALFIDGTWQRPTPDSPDKETNVRRLFDMTAHKPGSQEKYYLEGVGARYYDAPKSQWWKAPARVLNKLGFRLADHFKGGIYGAGMRSRIAKAYLFLARNYQRGDQIYIFGFSRGAFAARSLAGFADSVGLLLQECADEEMVEKAYAMYERSEDPNQTALRDYLRNIAGQNAAVEDNPLPVHLIGVWDTVAALNVPWRNKDFSAPFTEYHKTNLPRYVTHARHALAMHELRSQYEPLLWKGKHPVSGHGQSLMQVWFPGAHADVGGGYAARGLEYESLWWMAKEAEQLGLELTAQLDPTHDATEAVIHHEISGVFALEMPTIRRALTDPDSLSLAAEESMHVHRSCIPCWVYGKQQKNGLTMGALQVLGIVGPVSAMLRKASELGYELALRLYYRHGNPMI